MAYDDPRFRGESAFRAEPDYRTDDDSYAPAGQTGSFAYPGRAERTDGVAPPGGYPRTRLEDVFDDPAHGEPGRDRVAIHLIWELVLLLGVAGVGYLLYRDHRNVVTGNGLRGLLTSATVLGLLVLGAGLSLRAAAPNLAVGPTALAAAMYFADRAHQGLLVAAVQAILLGLAVGAAIAVLVVGLHVPGWAASFGVGLAVVVWIQQHHARLTLPAGTYQPQPDARYWFGGFAVVAAAGGIIGSMKPLRRMIGRFRPVADPAHRRGAAAGVVCAVALLVSSALAAGSGVLAGLQNGGVGTADTSLTLTGLALGGALAGGTSAFGRRGGLLGAVLSATLLTVVIKYLDVTDRRVSQLATAAAAIGVGLVVTRLVESYGRPRATVERELEEWRTISPSVGSGDTLASDNGWGGTARPTGWTSPLPASSADDRWGGDDTWTNR